MKKFYVGIKGIVHEKDKGILLLYRKLPSVSFWETPGGRIEEDESFEDTLKRELAEELPGIEVLRVGELLGAYRIPRDIDGDISLVLLYYLVETRVPDPVKISVEHQDYRWVKTASEIPKELNPEFEAIIRKLLG